MRETRQYYFSVEGETEKWYLDWLGEQINHCDERSLDVKINAVIQKNPIKYVKGLTTLSKITIYHIFDYESNEENHANFFLDTLSRMKESGKMGKEITYRLGYSNYTFELWILLHKQLLCSSMTNRKQYLKYINKTFSTNYQSLSEYKEEKNFTRILEQLSLQDVKKAISQAEMIMNQKQALGYAPMQYKGYTYYRENPALSVHTIIRQILSDCKIEML